MRLEVAGRQALDSPGSDDIEQAFALLDAGADYIRLCSDETTFIQFNGAILEHREDGALHRAAGGRPGDGRVLEAFLRFAAKDPRWRPRFDWREASRTLNPLLRPFVDPLARGTLIWIAISVIVVILFVVFLI